MTNFALDPLDLAALLCSRVCHDVISPVGAIVNGLEVLDDEKDAEMRSIAFDLIRKSAENASARLQFARLAFGAAGSAGASIDTGDAEKVVRGLFADQKSKVDWRLARVLMAKNKVKLILNLCLIAAAAIPRGGAIVLEGGEDDRGELRLSVKASGPNARLAAHIAALLAGEAGATVDAHSIQPYFTGLVAKAAEMALRVETGPDFVAIEATAVAAAAEEAA